MRKTSFWQSALFMMLITLNTVILLALNNRTKTANVSTQEDVSFPVRSLVTAIDLTYRSEAIMPNYGIHSDSILMLLLNECPILCLRISQKHCETCTFEALADFRSLGDSIPLRKVVFTDFNDPISYSAFKSNHRDYIVFELNSLGLKVDGISSPYIFLLERDMRTNMVFVHQKEFPEKTKNYFDALAKLIEPR